MSNQSKKDSEGKEPSFLPGERVFVLPLKMEATVVEQKLHYDGSESFWGNLVLLYDDGIKGTSNSWQCKKVDKG
jgi:hypothetical protein